MRKKPKIIREKLKDKTINYIWTLFEIGEEKEETERIIKDRIIRDISTLFEQEDNYYKPKRGSNF